MKNSTAPNAKLRTNTTMLAPLTLRRANMVRLMSGSWTRRSTTQNAASSSAPPTSSPMTLGEVSAHVGASLSASTIDANPGHRKNQAGHVDPPRHRLVARLLAAAHAEQDPARR